MRFTLNCVVSLNILQYPILLNIKVLNTLPHGTSLGSIQPCYK